jgi:hypothetical protein
MTRLAGQVCAAQGDRLRGITVLSQLVRVWREKAAWVLLELRPEFIETRVRHA